MIWLYGLILQIGNEFLVLRQFLFNLSYTLLIIFPFSLYLCLKHPYPLLLAFHLTYLSLCVFHYRFEMSRQLPVVDLHLQAPLPQLLTLHSLLLPLLSRLQNRLLLRLHLPQRLHPLLLPRGLLLHLPHPSLTILKHHRRLRLLPYALPQLFLQVLDLNPCLLSLPLKLQSSLLDLSNRRHARLDPPLHLIEGALQPALLVESQRELVLNMDQPLLAVRMVPQRGLDLLDLSEVLVVLDLELQVQTLPLERALLELLGLERVDKLVKLGRQEGQQVAH